MDIVRKVLVVSDDPAVAASVDETLPRKGITVVSVPTGEEALWALENGEYDAVLTELALRGMSGNEVAEEIRQRGLGLPVFVIARDGAEVTGAAGYLRLPLSPDQLTRFAEQVLAAAPRQPGAREAGAVPQRAAVRSGSRLRDVVLFLLAPVVALGYVIAFPVVGLGMLVFSAFKTEERPQEAEPLPAEGPKPSILKGVGMMIAVAAVGIFYGLVAPFLGIVLIVWFGLEAWGKVGARAVASDRT